VFLLIETLPLVFWQDIRVILSSRLKILQLRERINPDRIRYEVAPDGSVAYLLKSW